MNKKLIIIGISVISLTIIAVLVFLLSPYKIILNGESNTKINYKSDYTELGAYVTKLGIRMKKEVTIEGSVNTEVLGDNVITYKFKDAEKNRRVTVADLEAPVITIKGGDVTMFVNEDYIENGSSALDNYDGDVSKNVKVDSSKLDVSKEGEYNVEYSVCDAANNCSTENRKVSVTKGNILYGTFKQKTDVQSSILKLRGSDKTFTMDINACEGFVTIKGTYSVSNGKVNLKFKAKQYKGFTSQNDTKYTFSISNNDNIKFQSHDVLCGPYNADIYERVK